MRTSILLIIALSAFIAIGCSSAETEKGDAPDVVAVESADELTEDMYYYHYDPKTGKETVKGDIPDDKMKEIRLAKTSTNGKVAVTACSESYRQKYLNTEPDSIDPLSIDFRDSTIVNMSAEELDSILNVIKERVKTQGEA